MEEYFDIINEEGQVIGQATRCACHNDPNLIHRAVHILVVDNQDRIFLQKRSPKKDIQPGKWDTSVGGHLNAGETYDQAARRELEEEIGVSGVTPRYLYSYRWRTSVESEDVRTYLLVWKRPVLATPFSLQPEEITDGRFWSFEEIQEHIGEGILTPSFEQEFERYLQWRAQQRRRR